MHALVLLPRRNAPQLERLSAAYDVPLLRLDGPDALAAYCAEHGLGLSAEVVGRIVGADRLAAERAGRRRRARRTALQLAALAALIAGAVALAQPHKPAPGTHLQGRGGEIVVR